MTVYIGIDPGFTGAVAFLWPDEMQVEVFDMPVVKNTKGKTELDLHELLDIVNPETDDMAIAFIEQVGAMRGQGVSSMFRFGESYGATQMAVTAHKIPMRLITPAKWKAHFGLTRDKGVSRGLAAQCFPNQAKMFSRVKDDGRAEAALIALYGYEVNK